MRPHVSVSVPQALFIGDQVHIDVDVLPSKETKVDWIDAILTGDQGWTVGSGKSQVTYREKNPYLRARLMDEGVLAKDQPIKLRALFTLPPGTPPTHNIRPAWSIVKLRIHISIPWALDGRNDFELQVRVPPVSLQREPFAASSPITAADGARIEVAVASRRVAAGEILEGTVAVFHMSDDKPRDVDLDLVPSLELYGRYRQRDRRGDEMSTRIQLPAGSAGKGVPFRIQLPATMVPNFRASSHAMQWFLIAHTGSFFGAKAEVALPLHVLDVSAHQVMSATPVAPRLGDERIAQLFSAYGAQRGWKLDRDRDTLERVSGDHHLSMEYTYRGQSGAFVVGRISTPTLGLGLLVKPATARDVFFTDVEVDIEWWDREYHVDARAPDQAVPFLRTVAKEMLRSTPLGTLVRWTDTELVYERAVTVVDTPIVEQVDAHLQLLSAVIARAADTIAAPPGLTTDLAAWRALAKATDGVFSPGDLSLHGTHRGLPVELGLEWDAQGAPSGLHVALGDPDHASGHAREVAVTMQRPSAESESAPAELRDLLAAWPTDVVRFVLQDGVASAVLAVGSPPAVDVARVREVVDALVAVLAALDPARGPYR